MESNPLVTSPAVAVALAVALAACGSVDVSHAKPVPEPESERTMELGAFSISLAVKDIAASRAFYRKLGFEPVFGDETQNWLILRNGTTTIGLFQGMFENNIMTFNPGWNHEGKNLAGDFTDVREIQRRLEAEGIDLQTRADESTTGPASVVLTDPDGNAILIDQHR